MYPSGVTSVSDEQFIYKFETPYSPQEESLSNAQDVGSVPFYMTLGNHDCEGNINNNNKNKHNDNDNG